MKDYDNLYNLLSIENNKDKKYYVFIRLYDCVYKNKLSPGAILDKGIKLVSTEIESLNLKYNHASINYNLNDMFYGLTAAGGDFSLKFETLLKEIEKCVCVCANCHRKIHAGIINLEDYLNKSFPQNPEESVTE